MRLFTMALLLTVLLGGCASSKTSASKEAQLQQLEALIEGKSFEINPQWASPLLSSGMLAISNSGLLVPGSSAARIDIFGNASYFKVVGDTAMAILPYYGERQMGGGYNSSSGIEFNGLPTKYMVGKNTKKNYYTIQFTIRENSETYQVFLNLFSDMTASIFVNSSQRHPISYQGSLKPLTSSGEAGN